MKSVANKTLVTGLICLISFLQSGCKSEGESNSNPDTTGTANVDLAAKCAAVADDEDEVNSACKVFEIESPYINPLGDAPLTLDRTPRFTWGGALHAEIMGYYPVQVQIVRASDKTVIYPWTDLTMYQAYVEGLSLTEGEQYFFKLRSKLGNRKSKVIKSDKWTARVGKGTWGTISSINAPSSRNLYSAVWTGSKMIIWGGKIGNGNSVTNTGAIYDPTSDTWTTMSTLNAPPGRAGATAVWTGSEMIVWGGPWQCNGGRYNPNTNTWTTMTTAGAPQGCASHSAAWTGTTMIVWGGEVPVYGVPTWTNTGASYNPTNNTWTPISTAGAPSERSGHLAVWTGTEMAIWGGTVRVNSTHTQLFNGALYNPTTNTWRAMNSTGAPDNVSGYHSNLRGYHWTGSKILLRNGSYDPSTDTWEEASASSKPWDHTESLYLPASAKHWAATAWTGTKLFVWGGTSGWGSVNTGGLYDPTTKTLIGTPLATAPTPMYEPTAIWTGDKVLIWSSSGGATFTPEAP